MTIWLLAVVGDTFGLMILIALGQVLFRPHYSQVPVYQNRVAGLAQAIDTDTPSPTVTVIATATMPAGYTPWWNEMTATTDGTYLPPADVQAQTVVTSSPSSN